MNPMVASALGAIVRWALQGLAVWLVERGVWTQAEATTYVSAAAISLVALGWSGWTHYKSRQKLVTALAMPSGHTEEDVERRVSSGIPVPSVTTPKDVAPTAAV